MPKGREGESTRGGEHERGVIPSLVRGVWGSPPIFFFLILSASMCVFNVFYAFGNRFQSRFFC